jgi:hypothetical protein
VNVRDSRVHLLLGFLEVLLQAALELAVGGLLAGSASTI